MADTAQGMAESSDGGQSNGWEGRNIGGYLPLGSSNHAETYIFRRSFNNIVKTTDMNKVNSFFTRFNAADKGIKGIRNFAWAEPESEDYIVPYFLSTWVTLPKWEQTIKHTTSYRIAKSGFMIAIHRKLFCLTKIMKRFSHQIQALTSKFTRTSDLT